MKTVYMWVNCKNQAERKIIQNFLLIPWIKTGISKTPLLENNGYKFLE